MKGEIVYLYAFDVANEIATNRVEQIIEGKPVPYEITFDHAIPKDIPLYRPLLIDRPPLNTLMAGKQVKPYIRIYDIGIVSIDMRVEFETDKFQELLHFHNPVFEDGRTMKEVAVSICQEICRSIKEALIQAVQNIPAPEAYTIFSVTEITGIQNVNDFVSANRKEIAELITENKPGMLSDQQVNEVLRVQLTYSNKDIVIIDWDAAFIVDLTRYVEDTIYVLELANLQLEEYKIMDQRLDKYLNKAYDDVKEQKFGMFGANSKILQNLRTLRVDVTKLNDEVTHITKFFGDWYLARVYLGARERFHLDKWRNSVAERLTQLDALYSVVQSEISNSRMLLLEFIIVVFFAIDLIALFFFGK